MCVIGCVLFFEVVKNVLVYYNVERFFGERFENRDERCFLIYNVIIVVVNEIK